MNESNETKAGITEQLGEAIMKCFPADGNLKVTFAEDAKPLTLHEETPVKLAGILDSPARWVEARNSLIEGLECYVVVDREAMSIELVTEERNHFKNIIGGKLQFHPIFLKFGINAGKYISPAEMADKIKMNRAFFESKQDAMNLVAQLKDFKATIAAAIEKKNDNRGNVRELRQQEVTSNLPKAFNMKLPIFKGEKAKVFEVEVYVEAEDLTCTLISPEANEEMEALRDTAIDAVLDRIKTVNPAIVVIEK